MLAKIEALTILLSKPDQLTSPQIDDVKRQLAEAREAAGKLKALSRPFLNWMGKAERLSFDVPSLPLFLHERLSTEAIIDTLRGHKKGMDQLALFGDPQRSIADQILRAYEYPEKWVNRMILGDSLVVMNSLLRYEGMGGQVQMIYMDPPYGIRFGSNFQPFVRRREVSHNDDDDMTREPEMVKAYRDTWDCGLHSYLTYLRDRLLLCRELIAPSGSVFVQISDENLHHVREVMDEVFGVENYLNTIPFAKTSGVKTRFLAKRVDFLLWYARDKSRAKYNDLFLEKSFEAGTADNYGWLELSDGSRRGLTAAEKRDRSLIPADARIYKPDNITSQGNPAFEFEFQGKRYKQPWKTNPAGMKALAAAQRLHVAKNSLQYVRYLTDSPCIPVTQLWEDTQTGSFTDEKIYAVQTGAKTVERCIMMTTEPGDLVLDPTCGSGTTAYVAEQWGRRWITADVSRVPLALARQRLLTATFHWYHLRDNDRGPTAGFVYERKQNQKGEEVGGIVPHVTLEGIANNEPPDEEVLSDRPELVQNITRVCGPFAFEATIPTAVDMERGSEAQSGENASNPSEREGVGAYTDRMIEILRKVKTLELIGNRRVTLYNVRVPARTLSLSAEAMVDSTDVPGATLEDAIQVGAQRDGKTLPLAQRPVAFVFGPENGAVSEKLVHAAAKEAGAKGYALLIVVGFGIEPNARQLVEQCEAAIGVPATYAQATPDLLMGDLLKNMRSSQVFSVCGLPDVAIRKAKAGPDGEKRYQVELRGLDVFDPVTMKADRRDGNDVPAWFLDTDYNAQVFHVCQAFFPRTAAWDNLKKALKGTYDESVWDHLAGATSAPFEAGEHGVVAVKVIDDRGNELMVTKSVSEAK